MAFLARTIVIVMPDAWVKASLQFIPLRALKLL